MAQRPITASHGPMRGVNHSVSEYVRDQAHTNGIESFWALLKRGYHGIYHHMSEKHLGRYVGEFAGRHNHRDFDTIQQMCLIVFHLQGKRLEYREFDLLITDSPCQQFSFPVRQIALAYSDWWFQFPF